MSVEESLLGSWRLVSFEARTPSGIVIRPLGPDADGVVTYSPGRRMHAAVWAQGRRPFAADDQTKGSSEENAHAVATMIQYLGTFEVDEAEQTVTHHLEQSLFPNWNGVDQRRFYTLSPDGEHLELSTTPTNFHGEPLVGTLAWRRLTSG